MKPSLDKWPTQAIEAPFPHEVRLIPLDTNPVFQCFVENWLTDFTISFRNITIASQVKVGSLEL